MVITRGLLQVLFEVLHGFRGGKHRMYFLQAANGNAAKYERFETSSLLSFVA